MNATVIARRKRYGITRIEVVVIAIILVALAVVLIPQTGDVRETARGNTCRNNMRALATALFNFSIRHGSYPGYLNVLQTNDKHAFVDPTITGSTEPLPVSWVVMILPDIDRQPLFDLWKQDGGKPVAVANATTDPAVRNRFFTDQYIEQLLCHSDQQPTKTGTPISFVVNTGMPDLAAAIPGTNNGGDAASGTPRDWAANGMFFDNFSEDKRVKIGDGPRGPMEYMIDGRIADPKDKTILLTENVDATSYVFRAATHGADGWRAAEIQTGCIWLPGLIDATPKTPTMTPPAPSMQPNVGAGKGNGMSFDYCRPSSRHPEYVNVAFVGQNVTALRDTISYFVYAKLMTSDDERAAMPGGHRDDGIDPVFRTYALTDDDVQP